MAEVCCGAREEFPLRETNARLFFLYFGGGQRCSSWCAPLLDFIFSRILSHSHLSVVVGPQPPFNSKALIFSRLPFVSQNTQIIVHACVCTLRRCCVHVTPIMCAFEVVRPPPRSSKKSKLVSPLYFVYFDGAKNVSNELSACWGMKNGSWEAAFRGMEKNCFCASQNHSRA